MTQTASRLDAQRAFLLKIKNDLLVQSDKPNFDDCSKNEQEAVNLIVSFAETPGVTARPMANLFKKHEKRLKRLLTEETVAEPEIEVTRAENIVPPLEWGMLPKELAEQTGAWFREYAQFSTNWSRRAYQLHHIGTALWLTSTVAGGRIAANYSGLQYTPLSLAIVSPSSAFAKTTTVKIAEDTLRRAGLGWRFSVQTGSPEKLLSDMAGKFLPSNWEEMSAEDQEIERLRLAHSAQIAWYYSEFGEMLRDMANKTGRNAGYKAILLRMDDGEEY